MERKQKIKTDKNRYKSKATWGLIKWSICCVGECWWKDKKKKKKGGGKEDGGVGEEEQEEEEVEGDTESYEDK